jgi:CRP-like cAMP-binding protein
MSDLRASGALSHTFDRSFCVISTAQVTGEQRPVDTNRHDSHGLGRAQVYPKGVELFSQGAVLDEVLYIESGAAKLVRVDGNGRDTILELAIAGAWLGTAAVIARTPSPITAVTCTATTVARMDANVFRELLQRDPDLSRRIHELHAQNLCRQTGWIGQLSSLNSRQRLQRVVRELITTLRLQTSGSGVRLRIPLRQWELARLIAISPEHLSRLLKEMESDGVIRRDKGWVIVPDLARLHTDDDHEDAPSYVSRGATIQS